MPTRNGRGVEPQVIERSERQPAGLLVGEEVLPGERAFGFGSPTGGAGPRRLIHAPAGEHGLVFAGTGTGKFTTFVAGNCLEHDGPLIVIDCKGEVDAVVSRARAERGRVFVIDPFNKGGRADTYAFNPLDLASIPGESLESVAEMLASILLDDYHSDRDPYWANTAQSWLAGLIAAVGSSRSPARRHLGTLVDQVSLGCDALVAQYNLSPPQHPFAANRIRAMIETPGRPTVHTRDTIFTFVRQALAAMDDPSIRRAFCGRRRLDLAELVGGRAPNTYIIVFPMNRADSHRAPFAIWIEVLLSALASRPAIPPLRTRLIIDEAAAWGRRRLPAMYSYLRAAGVEVLTIWQSLGQLQDLYPRQWRTIVENAGVISAFGCHATAVDAIADLLGVLPEVVARLGPDQQLVLLRGHEPAVARRIDYRTHPHLTRYATDANPIYRHLNT